MAMCTICWFALHETLFIDVISICFFIEMVKLLEHKHFKISLYVLIYLNFLFVYFNTNSLKLWTTHIVLNIVLDPITGDVMNIVTLSNWQEEFEDTKGVIRIRISKKNRQHNGQKKKYNRTNNDL
jgi:hypothetical protein